MTSMCIMGVKKNRRWPVFCRIQQFDNTLKNSRRPTVWKPFFRVLEKVETWNLFGNHHLIIYSIKIKNLNMIDSIKTRCTFENKRFHFIDSINITRWIDIINRFHFIHYRFHIDSIYIKSQKTKDILPLGIWAQSPFLATQACGDRWLPTMAAGWLGENDELFPRKIVIYWVHIYFIFKWI